jgi:hypothetical protein
MIHEQKTILKIHCAKHPHRELELSDLSFIRVWMSPLIK